MAIKAETPVVENRLLAALAHGSVVMQGMGIVVGVLVYINQRTKSRFAAYQALQAAVFQLVTLIAVGVLWVLWGIFYMFTMIPVIQMGDNVAPPPIFWVGFASMLIPFGVMLIVVVVGLWAAWRTWQGKDFRYPVLGRWLEHSGLWESHAAE